MHFYALFGISKPFYTYFINFWLTDSTSTWYSAIKIFSKYIYSLLSYSILSLALSILLIEINLYG